jgi:hypothetical protein
MRARTLTELLTEVRALTDTVGDPHVTDAQLTVWINQGIAELWRKLVTVSPDRYAVEATIATTAGDDAYDLEDDFMSIYRVCKMDGTRRIPLEQFEVVGAPYHAPDPSASGQRPRYRVMGGGLDGSTTQIYFDPDPGTATYEYWYIQAPQLLVTGGDTFDGVAGYEDWVVNYTSLKVFIRQQDPEQVGIQAEMMRIEANIAASAARRDVGRAARIVDVRPRRRW